MPYTTNRMSKSVCSVFVFFSKWMFSSKYYLKYQFSWTLQTVQGQLQCSIIVHSGFVGPQWGPPLCYHPQSRPSIVTVRVTGKAIEGHSGRAKPRIQICFCSSGFYRFYCNYSSMFKAMKKNLPIWLGCFRHLERECIEIHLRGQSL